MIEYTQLIQTCGACPEQYEYLINGKRAGYLRLRHGYFYAAFPDVGGKVVYESYPKGDGVFYPDERVLELDNAIGALNKAYLEAHQPQ